MNKERNMYTQNKTLYKIVERVHAARICRNGKEPNCWGRFCSRSTQCVGSVCLELFVSKENLDSCRVRFSYSLFWVRFYLWYANKKPKLSVYNWVSMS